MGKLDDKVAIVTGASRGIGKAVAQLFAAEGARVVCAARTLGEGNPVRDDSVFTTVAEITTPEIPEGSLIATVSEIQKAGGTAIAVQADLSNVKSCTRLVEITKQVLGPVDILINNAVCVHYILIKDYPIECWIHTIAVNIHAPFILCYLVLPDMVERKSGAIVNLSSVGAIGPGRGPYAAPPVYEITAYGTTKAAIERFSQGLAQEVYQYGISVTCVAPSRIVPTPAAVYMKVLTSLDDPRGDEPPELMARSILLLATEPPDRVSGRVAYSQAILKEFGWITEGKGAGIDQPGSGYSRQ